jgi:fructose-bisphosphate aldolase class II
VFEYYHKNQAYLTGQIGNPEGEDKPNKKFYDPRAWLRQSEDFMARRLEQSFADLHCLNQYR